MPVTRRSALLFGVLWAIVLPPAVGGPADAAFPYATVVEPGAEVGLAATESGKGRFAFAPVGARDLGAGLTISSTAEGAPRAMRAPTQLGRYQLLAFDQQGVVRDTSRATLTVASHAIRRAREFTDSVGLNTHIAYETFPDRNWEKVRPLLLDLGIYRLRDTMYRYEPADRRIRYFNFLKSQGFRFICELRPDVKVLGTYDRWAQATVDQEIGSKLLAIRTNMPGLCFAIAGPNEPDGNFSKFKGTDTAYQRWPAALRMYMRGLRRRSGEYLPGLPVVGPGLAHPERYAGIVGDMSEVADFGDFHPYPGGRPFEMRIPSLIEDVRPMYPEPKRLFATETGYVNNLAQCCEHPSVTMRAMTLYLPRVSFEAFRIGLVHTSLFQFIDSFDPSKRGGTTEAFQGLVDFSYSPKPTYYTLRNMMALLKDVEAPFDVLPLSYSIQGPEDLRTVALQKSDGMTYLALWRAVSVCDEKVAPPKDRFPAAEKVRVKFDGGPFDIKLYRPVTQTSEIKTKAVQSFSGSQAEMLLDGELVLLAVKATRIAAKSRWVPAAS